MNRRGSAHSRGYGVAWRALRKKHLAEYPLCVMCERHGRIGRVIRELLAAGVGYEGVRGFCGRRDRDFEGVAAVVDHIVPHRGDHALLMDEGNLQSLCKQHHDSTKQSEERGRGRIDPLDPWGTR